jgi:hypothetical protein
MGGFTTRPARPEVRLITEANDAVTKWRLLDARRQLVLDSNRQRPLIRLWDKRFSYLGTVVSERSAEYGRLMDDSATITMSLPWSDWLADLVAHKTRVEEDLHITIDNNPNNRSWRTRLGYRVTAVRAVKNEDGTKTVELEGISLREHAKHLRIASTPVCPPEFQPIKSWFWLQNLRSGLAFTTFINLARNYWPFLAVPISLMDPVKWATTRAGNMSPLHWPVQVQFVNALTDTSRVVPITSRWGDLHSVAEPLMEDAGVCLVDYIWLPEDTTSPHPELAAIIGEEAARPSRACVVLAFEDKSGIVGMTGTPIDGVLDLISATLDDTITEVLLPRDADGDGITDPFFRQLVGAAPDQPSLVWRDCEYSGLTQSEHKLQRATSQTVYTGGQSPTWLNQALQFVQRWALAQIDTTITTGTGQDLQIPLTSGLNEVVQGQTDNVFIAFQKFTNPRTAVWLNDYALLEGFENGNGTAYVISSALTLRQGLYKRSPKVSFTMVARDGEPWCYGYDFTVGDRGLFEIDSIYYAEQIRGMRWSYSQDSAVASEMMIGKDGEKDPFDAGMKALADGWNAIGTLIGGAAVAE